MDPNPSSFLPLIFVLHNSTNLSSTICFTIVLPYGLVSYHPLLTILVSMDFLLFTIFNLLCNTEDILFTSCYYDNRYLSIRG